MHDETALRQSRAQGVAARGQGDRVAALGHFRAAAAADPTSAQMQHEIGTELLALGRTDEAESAFREAVALDPRLVLSRRSLGHIARRRGERALALEHFSAAAAADETNAKCRHEMATELMALGRAAEAEAAYRSAVDLDPGFLPSLRELGAAARRRGDHAEALRHFEAAAVAEPSAVQARHEVATELLELGRLAEAEAAYRDALALDPGFVESLRGLGFVRRRHGDHTAALAQFEAVATQTHDPRVRLDMASELVALGRIEEADRLCRQLLAHQATRRRALACLAQCARRRGDIDAVLRWLEQANADDPADAVSRNALADAYVACWDLAKAEAIYDDVLRAAPDDSAALFGKGIVARKQGRRDVARRYFSKAADFGARQAAFELAKELRDGGDHDGARSLLARLQTDNPGDVTVLMQLGLTARSAGDFEAASQTFAAVIRLRPEHVSAYVEQAADELRLGRVAKARWLLDRGAVQNPDHPRLLEAMGDQARSADALEAALDLYRRAAAADPTLIAPRLQIARCQVALGHAEEALATLECLRHDGFRPSPEYFDAKAHILRQTGRCVAAAAALREGTMTFPRHFALWLQKALLDLELGNRRAIALALSSSPASTAAEQAKARLVHGIHAAAGWDFAAAQAHYIEALHGNESDRAIHFRAAEAAFLNLDLDAAERHLQRVSWLDAGGRRLRGQSTAISQSLIGQLLDEARLDSRGLARLCAYRTTPPEARLDDLFAIVRDHPDYTPAAIQLMLALRRRGLLRSGLAGQTAAIVPAEIVQFWNSERVPSDVATLSETWRELNPGFRYARFSEIDARRFIAAQHPPSVLAAFRRAREPAMQADIFRLAYLVRRGGFYADADDRCIAPLMPLARPGCGLIAYQEHLGSIANNFLGCAPGHPVVERALAMATEAVHRGDSDILWLSTGPGLLTRAMAQVAAERGLGGLDGLAACVLERRELFQYAAVHCTAAYKLTRRYWLRTAFATKKYASG